MIVNQVTETATSALSLAGDMLEGAEEIAEFLFGADPDPTARRQRMRRVYHLTSQVPPAERLPVFKIAGLLFARKSRLIAWIAERERLFARET
jgi:hypothetical protein